MLYSGAHVNKIRRYSEFLTSKIAEKEAEASFKAEKSKQEKIYKDKLEAVVLRTPGCETPQKYLQKQI